MIEFEAAVCSGALQTGLTAADDISCCLWLGLHRVGSKLALNKRLYLPPQSIEWVNAEGDSPRARQSMNDNM
jgi:hypothetical protein